MHTQMDEGTHGKTKSYRSSRIPHAYTHALGRDRQTCHHAHTHTHTHTRAPTHTHTQTRTQTRTHIHARAHARTNTSITLPCSCYFPVFPFILPFLSLFLSGKVLSCADREEVGAKSPCCWLGMGRSNQPDKDHTKSAWRPGCHAIHGSQRCRSYTSRFGSRHKCKVTPAKLPNCKKGSTK